MSADSVSVKLPDGIGFCPNIIKGRAGDPCPVCGKGPCPNIAPSNRQRANAKRPLVSRGTKPPRRNDHAEQEFAFQCRAHRLPAFERQYKLAKTEFPDDPRRMWRFDFLCFEWKVIIEIDGGIWMAGGGAHSHPVDITRNMTKQNDATLYGYSLLRFTPREVKSGHAIAFTKRLLHAKGWRP